MAGFRRGYYKKSCKKVFDMYVENFRGVTGVVGVEFSTSWSKTQM